MSYAVQVLTESGDDSKGFRAIQVNQMYSFELTTEYHGQPWTRWQKLHTWVCILSEAVTLAVNQKFMMEWAKASVILCSLAPRVERIALRIWQLRIRWTPNTYHDAESERLALHIWQLRTRCTPGAYRYAVH